MRQKTNVMTALSMLLCLSATAAEPKSGFRAVSNADAERTAAALGEYSSQIAMWIWADKYVYQAGEQLTLRWTVKANNDYYPYTVFAYRVNNQTGARSYLPGNSSAATDISGRNFEQGYQVMRMADATKAVVAGSGGSVVAAPLTIPNELGMHTLTVELRDYTGTRTLKTAYFKIGVVSATEDLPNEISSDRRLTNDKAYRITGIVSVRNNATLTIDPGTFIIGMPGSQPPSVLLVTTQGRLNAIGTRSRPIIMTSSQPFGNRQRGDWGGLILLGDGPLNDPGRELTIEGLPELPETRYGGDQSGHNCGTLRYVRVEFAGALLRPNEETNSFTWGGCGTGTVSEYLQAHYGLDDSFEWFGGNNDAKYLVGTYGADDYVDVQVGYTGRIQHVVALANSDLSNRGVEADNYERDFAARPLGKAQMYNLTFVGNGGPRGFDESDSPCLYYRRGAGGVTNNVVCYNWTTRAFGGSNFDSIQPNINSGDFTANGVLMWNNGSEANRPNTLDAQVQDVFLPFARSEQGRNFVAADPMLRRPLELNDPDFRPMTGSPALRHGWIAPPDNGFFDQSATYMGAFGDIDWTEEWTIFIQEQDLAP